MKNFVLYSSSEIPHKISKEEFENIQRTNFLLNRIMAGKFVIMRPARSVKTQYKLEGCILVKENMEHILGKYNWF